MVTRREFSLIIAAVALTGAGTSLSVAAANPVYSFTVADVLVMNVLGTLLMQYSGPFERFAVDWFGTDYSNN